MPRQPPTPPTCRAEGCDAPAGREGLCAVCRRRAARHGGEPGPRGQPHGMVGDEALVALPGVRVPAEIAAALERAGAESLSAAVRLALEVWASGNPAPLERPPPSPYVLVSEPVPPDPIDAKTKRAARIAVQHALRSGRLVRQPCEVCGEPKSEAHHYDYTRPLDVQWLCARHHEGRGRPPKRIYRWVPREEAGR